MIKIIKEGKKVKSYKTIYIITCSKCGCEFECEDSDLTIERKINGKRSINCPCCKKEFILVSDDVGSPYNYKTRQEEIKEDGINYTSLGIPSSIHLESSTPWNKSDKEDPCETCPNRFGPRDGLGNPIAGDSPCEWCFYYKYKITYCLL